MSRGSKRDKTRDDAPNHTPPDAPTSTPEPTSPARDDAEAQALSAFFRELATRAERDPAFGAGLLSVAHASGLAQLTGADEGAMGMAGVVGTAGAAPNATPGRPDATVAAAPAATQPKGKRIRHPRAGANAPAGSAQAEATPQPAPDPFAIMRAQGEAGLRATLDALDLGALRQIVRAHRLDPARISARWANRDRVIALIVDQTRARLNHGRAFERV